MPGNSKEKALAGIRMIYIIASHPGIFYTEIIHINFSGG